MTTIYQSKDAALTATEKLRVFAQPQRLMILSLLLAGEFTVSEIEAATAIGQPALSQQLAALRRADVVDTRRDGKQIHYRLSNETIAACVRTIETLFGDGRHAPAPLPARAPDMAPKRVRLSPLAGAAAFAKLL